jgi:hypothetical protein
MHELKRVDVISVGKIMGLVYGFLALVFVPFILIAMITGLYGQTATGVGAGVVAIVLIIMVPVLYGGIAFVVGCVAGLVYNFIAGKFGGVKFQLKPPYASPTLPLADSQNI